MATLNNNTNNVMAQDKKYILLENDTIDLLGLHKLHRIQAVRDFGDVKSGDLGGYIESEYNLSQAGTCWVSDNAQVYGKATVYGDAHVSDNAIVCDHAHVYHDARVYGDAAVCDNARVYDEASVYNSKIFRYGAVGYKLVDSTVATGC